MLHVAVLFAKYPGRPELGTLLKDHDLSVSWFDAANPVNNTNF